MAQQPLNEQDGLLPSNYRELYAATGFQAGEPEPARLVASYRFSEVAGGGERPTPSNLKDQTFAFSDRHPMTFLCLARTTGTNAEVRVLHRMMRYFELPDAGGAAAADLSMGLLGDIRAAQMPVVEVDNTHFSLVVGGAGVRVPTVAVMPDRLLAAPPGAYLGPYGGDAPSTEVVRPRMTQVLPTKYGAALVHRDGVSPSDAYTELYGMFEADQVLDACGDVLTWLRAACTARGGGGELAPLPAVAHTFPLLLLPASVSNYVAAKVLSDLPGRPGVRAAPTPYAMDHVVAAVQQLAENVGGIAGRGAREPKGVMDAYRETHAVLQRYCHVATVEELAPLWSRLARGSKGEQQSILQQELTKVCTGRGLTPDVYCPAISTGLKQMVATLNFAGHGPDDIGAGCQPFLVAYTGADDHYRAMDNAMVANQLDQGTANASLADIRDIREKEKVKLPRDLNQVSYTLQRFAVLVHALFQGPGEVNPFVKCMWLLANTFNERLPLYLGQHQALRGTPWYDVYPAHVVRHVQINVYEYMQALQVSGAPEAPELPNFQALHRSLQRGSFHISSEWLPLPASVTVVPGPMGLAPAGAASVATRSTRASTASTTSGLTTNTGGGQTAPTRGGTNASQGAYVPNTTRDAEFDALQLRPQMRDLLRAHPPPANDAGHEFCVSWWGRGGCYTNCGRAATHRPFANNGERTRLLEHVRAHLTVVSST
jgi:hypothetical protein